MDEVLVTVKHDRVAYTVNVAQDLAGVIDDLVEEIYLVTPDGPYEWVLELADKLGQRAINLDPREA